MKGTTTGIADVYLDDVFQATVDLAGAVAGYQQKVWSTGAVSERHSHGQDRPERRQRLGQVRHHRRGRRGGLGHRLSRASSRPTAASPTAAAPGPRSPRVGASAGSYARTSSATGAAIVDFNGTYLAWIATKGTTLGKALCLVDGGAAVRCRSGGGRGGLPAEGLGHGHARRGRSRGEDLVRRLATPRASSSASTRSTCEGSLDQGVLHHALRAGRPAVPQHRHLVRGSSASASAGSYKFGGTGTGITVNFTGVRLDWIATTGPAWASRMCPWTARRRSPIDLSASSTSIRRSSVSTGVLTNGKHVVEISWDEGNAPGAFISVDAFDVVGSVPWELTLYVVADPWVEQRLSDLSYRPGTIDGVFDTKTRGAVIAFQKWEGLTRNGRFAPPC